MKRRICLLFLTGLTVFLYGQRPSEQQTFTEGLTAYRSGNYRAAEEAFMNMLQAFPQGRLSTATRVMLGKTYYKLKDYSKAQVVCQYFFKKFPDSRYTDDMHHLLGNTYYQLHQYSDAIEEWLWVVEQGDDARLQRTAADHLAKTLDRFISAGQIEALAVAHPGKQFQGFLTVSRARKMLRQGDRMRSQSLLQAFLQEQPNHPLADEARRLLGSPGTATTSGNRILFLKSTDPDTKEVSASLEMGMRYAVNEYLERSSGDALSLRTAEIEPDVLSALQTANEEIAQSNPLLIIGPVDADQNAGLATLSQCQQRPLIVPLSSQTGLAGLSSYTFQLNPDARTKGRFLGTYASRELHAKKIAVLAPANQYGENFIQDFTEEVQAAGSDIVTVQWYYEGAQDFSSQFRAIWRQGVFLAFQDSVLTTDSTRSESSIRKEYPEYLERKFEPLRRAGQIDSTEIAATGIDALLILIRSPQFIQYIAPQLAFNNITTQVLGNEGWNDPGELKKYKDHLEGLVFVTAGYYDPNSPDFRVFLNRFRSGMETSPGMYHLMGYDIMRWILSNYRAGITADALRESLENTAPYQGILEDIEFGSTPRVNSKLTLLKLNFGRIIRLN